LRLFSLTAERTALGGDAAAENRAALLNLTFYANQRPLGMLVPAAYQWPRPLADAVGLWKELADRG